MNIDTTIERVNESRITRAKTHRSFRTIPFDRGTQIPTDEFKLTSRLSRFLMFLRFRMYNFDQRTIPFYERIRSFHFGTKHHFDSLQYQISYFLKFDEERCS